MKATRLSTRQRVPLIEIRNSKLPLAIHFPVDITFPGVARAYPLPGAEVNILLEFRDIQFLDPIPQPLPR